MKCADCGQDILQLHPEMCPYCKSKKLVAEEDASKLTQEIERLSKAGKLEEAAERYEKLEMWNDAKDCRMRAYKKKHPEASELKAGKIGSVNVACPNCGHSQTVLLKSETENCSRCGFLYRVPKPSESEDFEGKAKKQ